MTTDLRALIFDLDGVIADTNTPHCASWERLSQETHIPFSRADFTRMLGLSRRDCLNVFLGGRSVDEATAQDLLRRKNMYFLDLLEQFTPADAAPGVRHLIEDARAAGLKIGLGSSSQNAKRVLQKLDLLDYFDVIGDGGSVPRHKPAPDIFLWVAGQLGVQPAEAIVFEDSRAGVAAAAAGGFPVVGIGSQQQVEQADWIVPSLADVRLATLRRWLDEHQDSPIEYDDISHTSQN